MAVVDLEAMAPAEAAEFLSHGNADTGVTRELAQVVQLCGASPLALSMVKTMATETCPGTGNGVDWRRIAGLLDKAAKAGHGRQPPPNDPYAFAHAAMTVAVDGLDGVIRACYESTSGVETRCNVYIDKQQPIFETYRNPAKMFQWKTVFDSNLRSQDWRVSTTTLSYRNRR